MVHISTNFSVRCFKFIGIGVERVTFTVMENFMVEVGNGVKINILGSLDVLLDLLALLIIRGKL